MTVHSAVHRHQNPPTIHAPRGYSHVVEASAPGRTIYIAGQVGVAPDGKIANDFRAQVATAYARMALYLEPDFSMAQRFVGLKQERDFKAAIDSLATAKA